VVAHFIGQKKEKEANEAAKQSLFSIFGLGLFITFLLYVFRHPVIEFLYGSAEPAVMKGLYIYLIITLATYPFMAVTSLAGGVLRGAGDTRTPMKVTMLMNIVNVILSYVLMYGVSFNNRYFYLNIPGFGVTGAAIGISIARIFGAAMMLFILFKGSSLIHLKDIWLFRFNMNYLKSVFGVGLPAGFESLLFNIGRLITQIFIVGMGTAATASNYIANSIANIVYVPGNAFCIVIVTMVGQSLGKKNIEEAEDTMLYLVKFSSLCLLIVCAVVFPISRFLVSLYSKESIVIDLAVDIVRLALVMVPLFWSAAFVLPAGLRGAGDVKYTMLISIAGMWLCRIVMGYVLGIRLGLGVQGVWIGMYMDWTIRGTLYLIRLKSGKWKQKKVIRSDLEAEAI
ncbi:MAG: MATE family efflux transporter, partial [Clostridiales bacterium]|nr:MATE family efflux transporter [Clostridiales bacterium]